jgi:hypothetical protein
MRETMDGLHGLLAEFETPEALLDASRRAYAAGYRRMEAYTPFPVHGLTQALGFERNRLPILVLIGGLAGMATGLGLQFFVLSDYPINVGGRPLQAWPAWVPVTFELTILFASLTAVLGMFALNGLPRPYHPLFGVPRFDRATRDRFFLCIHAGDPLFEREGTRAFLEGLKPSAVEEVPA